MQAKNLFDFLNNASDFINIVFEDGKSYIQSRNGKILITYNKEVIAPDSANNLVIEIKNYIKELKGLNKKAPYEIKLNGDLSQVSFIQDGFIADFPCRYGLKDYLENCKKVTEFKIDKELQARLKKVAYFNNDDKATIDASICHNAIMTYSDLSNEINFFNIEGHKIYNDVYLQDNENNKFALIPQTFIDKVLKYSLDNVQIFNSKVRAYNNTFSLEQEIDTENNENVFNECRMLKKRFAIEIEPTYKLTFNRKELEQALKAMTDIDKQGGFFYDVNEENSIVFSNKNIENSNLSLGKPTYRKSIDHTLKTEETETLIHFGCPCKDLLNFVKFASADKVTININKEKRYLYIENEKELYGMMLFGK